MYFKDSKYFSHLLINPYYIKDPKLYEIFKSSLPPKEAYYYFPKGEDIITIDQKNPINSLRKIFTNVPFTNFEKKWLKQLNKIIDSNDDVMIPPGWHDGLSLGCIYSALGDIEFAYEIMCDYIKWWQKTFPMNIVPKDKSWELLNNGFLYIYGRDHRFRPIMVCQPYILQNKLDYFSNSDVVKVCLFVCQYAVNNLLIPGQIENWIMFFNLKGTSLLSLPEPIKLLVKELSDNFNFRLYKCYVLGMSLIMRILYKFVCTFIGQPNEDKIVILSGKKDEHIFDDFTPDNLEQRFGGNAPDLIYGDNDCLFPPRVPCDNVFFSWENKNDILITEEEYINKLKKGDIPIESISPFILQKLDEEEEEEKRKLKDIKNNNNIEEIIDNDKNNKNNKINEYMTNNDDIYIPKHVHFKIDDKIENNKIILNIDNYNRNSNIINKRQKKKNEIINFLNSTDWKIENEFTNRNIFKVTRKNNFINDIKLFIQKRELFKEGITKLK
jgi:hypothetical protein